MLQISPLDLTHVLDDFVTVCDIKFCGVLANMYLTGATRILNAKVPC